MGPCWHLCRGGYQWRRRPAEEPDQPFDVLGSGRQEDLLSDELQSTEAQATEFLTENQKDTDRQTAAEVATEVVRLAQSAAGW